MYTCIDILDVNFMQQTRRCSRKASVDVSSCQQILIRGDNQCVQQVMQRELSHYKFNKLCVMVSLVCGRCWFEPRSGQTKDYKIGICCFSANHAALRRKSKDWLARNQDNVSEWGDMLFQRASTIKIQLSMLVQDKADLIIIISLKIEN